MSLLSDIATIYIAVTEGACLVDFRERDEPVSIKERGTDNTELNEGQEVVKWWWAGLVSTCHALLPKFN